MKILKTDPGAKRLMESLRHMGYDCSTAIADLIDNSIAADASEIHIDIAPRQDAFRPATIVVDDNGIGMTKEQLQEAMRFGTYLEYSHRDLGKYGLGMKTASLSQCRVLTVSSKPKSNDGIRSIRHCMRWDIDHVYKTDGWDLLLPGDNELEPWEKEIINNSISQENGTVITWSRLETPLGLLSTSEIRNRDRFLAQLIKDLSDYLSMVFHRFMQGTVTGRKKLNIYVCGEILKPWDPFCRNENTHELDILRIPVTFEEPDGSKLSETLTVSPFILPREDEFSSAEAWKEASGPKNWNQQQGFYFYRNDRLIQAGGWNRLRTIDEHTKLIRIAVDFTGELDRAFAINITKMRASIPNEIKDQISAKITNHWIKKALWRYRGNLRNDKDEDQRSSSGTDMEEEPLSTVEPEPKDTSDPNIEPYVVGNQIIVNINNQNDILEFLEKYKTSGNIQIFYDIVLGILKAVSEKRITPEQIPMDLIEKIFKEKV